MVIVLGAGISGLSTAYYLVRKYPNSNLKLLIVEAAKRCGGWIQSDNRSDYLFEAGPRTIRPAGQLGANTLNLIEDLGLADDVIPISSKHPDAKTRMIYAKGKINPIPSSMMDLFRVKPPLTKSMLSVLFHDYRTKPKTDIDDDTIYNFFSRRFGQELADYLISPMICGIYAGDAKEITVKSLFSSLFEMEQKYGGVCKGLFKVRPKSYGVTPGSLAMRAKSEKWSIYSMRGGLERLPLKLHESLNESNVQTYTDHKVNEISFYKDNTKVRLKIRDDYSLSSDYLFSSIPSYELGRLIRGHPELSGELSEIPFADVAVINLQYNANVLKYNGFGFLIPPIERIPILGVIFDSCCFTGQKGTVLTAMMGGRWFKDYFGDDPTDEYLLNTALEQINKILNIEVPPDAFKVNVLRKCIPQYTIGHFDRVERIRKYIKQYRLPISVCGSSYDGVGVNDVIMSARNCVDASKFE